MLIHLSNVLTDNVLAKSDIWSTNGNIINGPIKTDISLFDNLHSIKIKNADLLDFYFSLKDSLFQTVLRSLISYVRVDYEIVYSFAPVNDSNNTVRVIFPEQYDSIDQIPLFLSLIDLKEIIILLETCIRHELVTFRYNIFSCYEKTNLPWLFDVLRIIDNDVEVCSRSY